MRIKSVEIWNFRCIHHVQIKFDSVTTFLGPNGAGKSSILRALDWFFNGTKNALTEEDVYSGVRGEDNRIQVSVTFDQLTSSDRTVLGEKYAPSDVDTFTAWRTWENGSDKITGKALAFAAFEKVRAADGAKGKRAALEEASAAHPDLELPPWTTIPGVEKAMDSWERSHPEHLEEARVSSTHFFGFNGQGKLSGLFDYVLVAADLRASEESVDGNNTIIGRILERAIDREAANDAFRELFEETQEKQQVIVEKHLLGQLDILSDALSTEVKALASGRTVQLRAKPSEFKAQPTRIAVSILDQSVETPVDRQGHGFQRAMLISALKLLAGRSAKDNDESVICLAIEEPELFQHPTQARVFSTVLRKLAQDGESSLQVTYATHSPYFIEPRYFDQIRRVTRHRSDGNDYPTVSVFHASMSNVCSLLAGTVSDRAIRSRWDQVCIKNLDEAFFANAVVLIEGDGDKAIIDGIAARTRDFSIDGIVTATAHGKGLLFIPHAILSELGIPTVVVFDNDQECRSRMVRNNKPESKILDQERENKALNRKFCRYFSVQEEDYPEGLISSSLVAIPDTLESVVNATWPEWKDRHEAVISSGRGVDGKNAATYALAAEECSTDPVGILTDVIKVAREICDLGVTIWNANRSIPVQSSPSLIS